MIVDGGQQEYLPRPLDSLFSPRGEGARRADEGASIAGLSFTPLRASTVRLISTMLGVLGATFPSACRNRIYVRGCCSAIRLPAPSPRGEKRMRRTLSVPQQT